MHEGRALYVDHTVQVNWRRTQPTHYDPQETEANDYAANLLMPRGFITRALSRLRKSADNNVPSVADLASRFDVSTQAMEFRLTNLGLALPT